MLERKKHKMQLWNRYYTGLALIAALCFAVLSGLHAARPISDNVALSEYGYAADDICGFGEDVEQRDCPNCTLATGVVASGGVELLAWQAASFERVLPIRAKASIFRGIIDPYQARGPPLFT